MSEVIEVIVDECKGGACRNLGNIWHQYFWPHDGNDKSLFEARYLGVHISGLTTAMEKADSRKDIWCPYFYPHEGNEKG
jgi:hypothetical protein